MLEQMKKYLKPVYFMMMLGAIMLVIAMRNAGIKEEGLSGIAYVASLGFLAYGVCSIKKDGRLAFGIAIIDAGIVFAIGMVLPNHFVQASAWILALLISALYIKYLQSDKKTLVNCQTAFHSPKFYIGYLFLIWYFFNPFFAIVRGVIIEKQSVTEPITVGMIFALIFLVGILIWDLIQNKKNLLTIVIPRVLFGLMFSILGLTLVTVFENREKGAWMMLVYIGIVYITLGCLWIGKVEKKPKKDIRPQKRWE